jgi:threonine synthase
VSTRGRAPALPFDEVLLAGLARDGGLYVPAAWPVLADPAALRDLSYADLAARVMAPFVAGALSDDELARLVHESYAGFDHPDVAPLTELKPGLWLMELFHGPTLAFKDYALQFVGRAFDHVLTKRGERVTIVGATSGDTGSAAIEACRDRAAIDIFILHPKGRISEVQRRQMTTVTSANVHNIAVEGTFDDCQDLVKALFNDAAFRDRHRLSAVNSINWARIMAQTVYYVWAALRVGAPDRVPAFAVPTGNFGNVFAGYAAHRMGLRVARLIVGSNRNDILTRFFHTGRMEIRDVVPTLSPSMDIQISSNFERLLFELYDRDGARVARTMEEFRRTGGFALEADRLAAARALFAAERFDDADTTAIIRRIFDDTGVLVDPHTAVGIAAAEAAGLGDDTPVVALATAHPAKFPDAAAEAIGAAPEVPPRLAGLAERAERCTDLPADLGAVRDHIAAALGAGARPESAA